MHVHAKNQWRTNSRAKENNIEVLGTYLCMTFAIYLSIYIFSDKSIKFICIGLCFKICDSVKSKVHVDGFNGSFVKNLNDLTI